MPHVPVAIPLPPHSRSYRQLAEGWCLAGQEPGNEVIVHIHVVHILVCVQ